MHSETHMIELDGERVEEADLLESHDCHPITDARARIGRLADEVRITGRSALLTRHGRPAVAVVSAEDAMRLLALRRAQERRGLEAARVARAAGGQDVPVDPVLAAHGDQGRTEASSQQAALHRAVVGLVDEGLLDEAFVPDVELRLHRVFQADAREAAAEEGSEQGNGAREAAGEQTGAV